MGIADKLPSSRPMSIRSFAEASETSPRRIRRLIRSGRLRTIENQVGEVRIPESELERVRKWKESRQIKQSMELVPSGTFAAIRASYEGPSPVSVENTSLSVSLVRHEAALMRLGFLESEIAHAHRQLQETIDKAADLQERAEAAEHDCISATVRAVEAEHKVEELRTELIDSTFRAVQLQDEITRLQDQLSTPWWKKALNQLRKKQPSE